MTVDCDEETLVEVLVYLANHRAGVGDMRSNNMARNKVFAAIVAMAWGISGVSAKGADPYNGEGLIMLTCVVGDNVNVYVALNVATHEVSQLGDEGAEPAPALASTYEDGVVSWIMQSDTGKIFWATTMVGEGTPLRLRVFEGGKQTAEVEGKCTASN